MHGIYFSVWDIGAGDPKGTAWTRKKQTKYKCSAKSRAKGEVEVTWKNKGMMRREDVVPGRQDGKVLEERCKKQVCILSFLLP